MTRLLNEALARLDRLIWELTSPAPAGKHSMDD